VAETGCGCEGHGLAYAKLRMVCGRSAPKESACGVRLWAGRDVLTPGVLGGQFFSVIISEEEEGVEVGANRNAIVVRELEEVREVLGLSLFELEKRCKLDYLLRLSHRRFQIESARSRLL
jgi:hypothetical protein